MTDYTRVRNTLMSNPNGILNTVMGFGLSDRIKSNTRLYFYKYNLYDLVEISFENDIICVYDFKHTEDRAVIIRDNVEFYTGYFKTAGLEGKRFLFDLSLKLPVNYNDFVTIENVPNIEDREFAFILDKKIGYITDKFSVNVFVASERTPSVDKCILSFMNNSINVTDPKQFELSGCMNAMIISGLLSGISYESLEKEYDIIDDHAKFVGTINSLDFSSNYIKTISSKLKIDKFKRILQKSKPDVIQGEVIKQEILKGEVSLRDIVDQGLDRFMKSIKNPKDVIKVIIDCENQTIRSAYIVKGTMNITPVTLQPISYFRELLNSDNVEYILN